MPHNELEIQFESLIFDDITQTPVIGNDEYVERCAKLPDGSKWVFRDFIKQERLAKEKLYWKWVNQFFPTLILERYNVYKIENDEKVLAGSCWKKCFIGEKKLLESDVERLVNFDVPLTFAILFFLNQSYSCVNSYFIDRIDSYKIDCFTLAEGDDKNILDKMQNKEFANKYWLGLLHIAFMPTTGWDAIFIEKQMKLRRHLVTSSVLEMLCGLSSHELSTCIILFCRQFTNPNSKEFYEYRNGIIKNYCFFLADLFAEKIKKAAEQFLLNLEKSDRDDKRRFGLEMIKSCIGKIYLNTQTQLSSEPSLDYFVRCSSILTILINLFPMGSLHSHETREIEMLATAFQRMSEIAVNTEQLKPVAIQDGGLLKIELDKFAQPGFAQQCVDWLKRTETDGLRDVLLNKNLLIYLYQRAAEKCKGVQSTSFPRLLFAPQSTLPAGMEQPYQKIIHEKNPDQLCVHLFELMRIAPENFWNLFLRQLAIVVFSENEIMTISKNVMLPDNQYAARFITRYIEQLFSEVEVSLEALLELNAHFKAALQIQIKESRDSQTSGFRMSGSEHTLFSSGAAAAASSRSDVSASNQQASVKLTWSEVIGSYLKPFFK